MEDESRPTVLVVDDDEVTREILKVILNKGKFRLAGEVSNGQDALTQFESQKT